MRYTHFLAHAAILVTVNASPVRVPGSPISKKPTLIEREPSLPVITDGSGSGSCKVISHGTWGMDFTPIDQDKLQDCLLNAVPSQIGTDPEKWLDVSIGQAYTCEGMVSFQSASQSWNSPLDCHNACKNCLSQEIANGANAVWCDAWAGSAHCWEGFIIPDPTPITDGSSWDESQQRIDSTDTVGQHGNFIDKYRLQDCLRRLPNDKPGWLINDDEFNCWDMVTFQMSGTSWDSSSDCYNANKNCVSDAVNKGASSAFCDSYNGFAHCWLGFYLRDWPLPLPNPNPGPTPTPVPAPSSTATPTSSAAPTSTAIPQAEVDAANTEFPGIWWKTAQDTCTADQFRSLVSTTRDSLWLLGYKSDMSGSIGWDKFFAPAYLWDQQYSTYLDSMKTFWGLAQTFISNGNPNGYKGRGSRINYFCGDGPESSYNRCLKSPNVMAYVPISSTDAPSAITDCTGCDGVFFCPKFFTQGSSDRANIRSLTASGQPAFTENNINDQRLVTKETAMTHEWFHLNKPGYAWHITDLTRPLKDGSLMVYGPTRCQEYAWQGMAGYAVTPDTRLNADSYAWVQTYNVYADAWGWTGTLGSVKTVETNTTSTTNETTTL